MINEKTIEEIKQRLVGLYNPVEIYLFGSYAWGRPTEDSDLDLLIIVDPSIKDFYKALVQGYMALYGLCVAKNLLMIHKDDFDRYSKDQSRFYYKIKKEGKRIYARA